MRVVNLFFEIAAFPTVFFVWFSRNLAHIIYVPVREKDCGIDFRNFDFKIFGEFFKF